MQNGEGGSGAGLRAEIVTTGTELLLGEIVDTNAAWMAQQLRDIGVNLYYKTTVGDNLERVRGVIELGMSRSNVIIVSGGLGPTVDDVTRHAIAEATGRELEVNQNALDAMLARFARFGSQMTENNKRQALIPQGATMIENPVGTAPGFIVETEKCAVIALPGVPREMKHLMTATVLPYLRRLTGDTSVIRRRVLRTVGIGESMVDNRLAELMHLANPTIGLAAHTAQVDVRITARAENETEADRILDNLEEQVRERIGAHIFSTTPGEPFEVVLARILQSNQLAVSLLESNTGGVIARRLLNASPTSRHIRSHWTIDDPDVPETVRSLILGDMGDSGSGEERARAAAEAVATTTGSDYSLVVLGTRGADEGVFGSANGQTWLAIHGPEGTASVLCSYGGTDEYTVTRIGNQTLGLLWERLKRLPSAS